MSIRSKLESCAYQCMLVFVKNTRLEHISGCVCKWVSEQVSEWVSEWVRIICIFYTILRMPTSWQYRDRWKAQVGTMSYSYRLTGSFSYTVTKTSLHVPYIYTVWSTVFAQPRWHRRTQYFWVSSHNWTEWATTVVLLVMIMYPNKHTLKQCCFIVGPTSSTLAQH